jgi:hypothetical protein
MHAAHAEPRLRGRRLNKIAPRIAFMPPFDAAPNSLPARWGWKASALVLVSLVVALRIGVHHEASMPVDYPHDYYLAYLARVSTAAHAARETYYTKHQRVTVASKHFVAMCAIMVRAARSQGARPESFATEMTHTCESNGRNIKEIP